MEITKTITLDVEQYSLIQVYLEQGIKACEEVNEFHEYDDKIAKIQEVLCKIKSAKTRVVS